MTKNQFFTECEARTIHPAIALENDELLEALQEKDDARVIQILDEQF
jgi:hypothetical protein